MTAHVLAGDIERCLASGMDAYLPKPINPHELFDCVERWAQAPGHRKKSTGPLRDVLPIETVEPVKAADEPPAQPPLAKEDEKPTEEAPAEEPAANRRVISWFEKNGQGGKVPDTSPLKSREAPKPQIQAEPPAQIPGASVPLHSETAADASNEDEFLSKTIDSKRQNKFGDSLYMTNILPRFGYDMPFFLSMFEEFIEQVQGKIAELKKAVEEDNPQAVKRLAHNLKGVSANFEVTQITIRAHEMDTHAVKGDLSTARKLIEEIEAQVPGLVHFLEEIRNQESAR
jgi:HPt (histidine-containing phosphotransfer) domain-containing protein